MMHHFHSLTTTINNQKNNYGKRIKENKIRFSSKIFEMTKP